jgi:hypothetical protein
MVTLLNSILGLFKSPRFEMIQVKEDGLSRGWHVGVLDKEREMVLELVKDVAQRPLQEAIIKEIPMNRFGGHGRYKIIKPYKDEDKGSDIIIEERWNEVLDDFNNMKPDEYLVYHASGNLDYGMNCESLAYYIMIGRNETRNGKFAGFLHQRLGIDVGIGESRNPASSNFNNEYGEYDEDDE